MTMGEARKLGDQVAPPLLVCSSQPRLFSLDHRQATSRPTTRSDPSDMELDSRRQDRPASSERYNSVKRSPAMSIIGPVEQVSHNDPSVPLSVADGDEP